MDMLRRYAECRAAEDDLLSVSIVWIDDNNHNERFLSEVDIERSGADSVATCLGV
jgi:hypothetical protein